MRNSKMIFKPMIGLISAILLIVGFISQVHASELNKPWRDKSKALVLDAYEFNPLDWQEIVKDKRIAGFIGKASDGLSPKYCPPSRKNICSEKWRKYSVTKELYHTRRQLAKALGLKWGAYHLARADNPIKQAVHFLQFAEPEPDEVIVLDIEGIVPGKFMSLEDAETFAKYINKRLGRYPLLYTNHATASHIAYHAKKYPLLSRLKLWYARYIDDVSGVFPMGNWQKPDIWQFAFAGNCKKKCPYRVKGTPRDIDVNATTMTVAELRKAWPFNGLVENLVEEKPKPEAEILMVEDRKMNGITIQHNIGFVGAVPVRAKPSYAAVVKAIETNTFPKASSCDAIGFVEGPDGLESC